MFPKRFFRVYFFEKKNMARILPKSLRSVRRFIKPLYLAASLLLIWLGQLLNLLFLDMARTPVFAKVPEATSIVQSLQNPSQLVQHGKTLYEIGQFADAAKVWQQAAQMYKSFGDRKNLAKTLSFISLAYQKLGHWEKASTAIAYSLQLLKGDRLDTKDSKLILAQSLNTQGHLQLALGQAELALTTWQQATAAYAAAGNDAGITGSLINQAQALQNLGFYERASKTLTQLEQTLQNQPESLLKATGLRSLGNALFLIGDLEQSQRVLQQSLKIALLLKSPQEVGAILISLGNTAKAQQNYPAALKFYQQAALESISPTTRIQAQLNQLSLLLENKSSKTQALWPQIQSEIVNLPPSRTAVYARINFAQSLIRIKQSSAVSSPSWTEIGQLLATAVQQARSIEDPRAEAYALGHLGSLYEQTQQWSSAQDLTQQALSIASSIKASDIAYRWQWQLGRILKAQGNIEGAIANYTSAVDTLQFLRRDLVAINSDVQFSFRESVEPVYRELVELRLRQKGTVQPSQEDLKQARQTIESLQLAELENFFRSACLDTKVEIDLVVDSENSTAAVIYAIILQQQMELVVKLPHQEKLRHYTIPIPQNQAESIIASLQEDLRDVTQTSRVKKQSQQLYDWLIRPVEAELASNGVKSLVFVLDGALRNIPMAVLYDHLQQKYLVEKYALALTPGLQLVAPEPLQGSQLNVLTAGASKKRSINGEEFSRLENVERELKGIQSVVSKSKELFNRKFTETNLDKEIKSASFSVVHLATHGEFS